MKKKSLIAFVLSLLLIFTCILPVQAIEQTEQTNTVIEEGPTCGDCGGPMIQVPTYVGQFIYDENGKVIDQIIILIFVWVCPIHG